MNIPRLHPDGPSSLSPESKQGIRDLAVAGLGTLALMAALAAGLHATTEIISDEIDTHLQPDSTTSQSADESHGGLSGIFDNILDN